MQRATASALDRHDHQAYVHKRLTSQLLIQRERQSTLLNIKRLEMPREFDQVIQKVLKKTVNKLEKNVQKERRSIVVRSSEFERRR